jgi:hypothetical protein
MAFTFEINCGIMVYPMRGKTMDIPMCPRCSANPRKKTGIRVRSYCADCERELSREAGREFRARNPDYFMFKQREYVADPANAQKIKAREQVRQAVKQFGLVLPKACEKCGSDADLQKHHEDYNKPLDVVVLCRPCHAKLHAMGGYENSV